MLQKLKSKLVGNKKAKTSRSGLRYKTGPNLKTGVLVFALLGSLIGARLLISSLASTGFTAQWDPKPPQSVLPKGITLDQVTVEKYVVVLKDSNETERYEIDNGTKTTCVFYTTTSCDSTGPKLGSGTWNPEIIYKYSYSTPASNTGSRIVPARNPGQEAVKLDNVFHYKLDVSGPGGYSITKPVNDRYSPVCNLGTNNTCEGAGVLAAGTYKYKVRIYHIKNPSVLTSKPTCNTSPGHTVCGGGGIYISEGNLVVGVVPAKEVRGTYTKALSSFAVSEAPVPCAGNNVPNEAGTACEPCPSGEAPNADNTECVEPDSITCAGNNVPNEAGTACEPCPSGEAPNADNTECVEPDSITCAGNNVPNEAGTACEPCPSGEAPNADNTECNTSGVTNNPQLDINFEQTDGTTVESGEEYYFGVINNSDITVAVNVVAEDIPTGGLGSPTAQFNAVLGTKPDNTVQYSLTPVLISAFPTTQIIKLKGTYTATDGRTGTIPAAAIVVTSVEPESLPGETKPDPDLDTEEEPDPDAPNPVGTVTPTKISSKKATIVVTTTKPTKKVVQYGPDEDDFDYTEYVEEFDDYEEIELTNDLDPGSDIYYQVSTIDETGEQIVGDVDRLKLNGLPIKVIVYNTRGEPAKNARMSLASEVVTTNDEGEGLFENAPVGEHEVLAETDYGTYRTTLSIKDVEGEVQSYEITVPEKKLNILIPIILTPLLLVSLWFAVQWARRAGGLGDAYAFESGVADSWSEYQTTPIESSLPEEVSKTPVVPSHAMPGLIIGPSSDYKNPQEPIL